MFGGRVTDMVVALVAGACFLLKDYFDAQFNSGIQIGILIVDAVVVIRFQRQRTRFRCDVLRINTELESLRSQLRSGVAHPIERARLGGG